MKRQLIEVRIEVIKTLTPADIDDLLFVRMSVSLLLSSSFSLCIWHDIVNRLQIESMMMMALCIYQYSISNSVGSDLLEITPLIRINIISHQLSFYGDSNRIILFSLYAHITKPQITSPYLQSDCRCLWFNAYNHESTNTYIRTVWPMFMALVGLRFWIYLMYIIYIE